MSIPHTSPDLRRYGREKAELEAVLGSGIFSRAPILARFLAYVCEKHFAGEADQIKEYNIAVEALGRSPDFDQKKDAIVRVEAHRLRKRLKEYYESDGAAHGVHILIPQGHYAPQFRVGDAPSVEVIHSAAPSIPKTSRRWILGVATVLAILATGVAGRLWWTTSRAAPAPAVLAKSAGVGPVTDELRILAGSLTSSYVDSLGKTWVGDRFFSGGREVATPNERILQTRDPAIFRARREGNFDYDIPLRPGVYELRLYFAETTFGSGNLAGGAETSRLFHVAANGVPLLSEFDIIADAGGSNVADIRVFKDISPASDGYLHLKFSTFKETAVLSGLEILPSAPGRIRPIRVTASNTPYTDKHGQAWEPDRYFQGGQTVSRGKMIGGTPDPDLFAGERFGNFTYVLPVTEGRYRLTLRFAETWFGPSKPTGLGPGARLFDVYCNGVALLRNFDIFKEAGGEDRAVEKTFRGLQPNAQGKLILSFVPVKNYACVNAIEVVDEAN